MDMDRYIGRLLDNRYEILEVIGSGGMAVVYKARCHRLNRLVAIKILKDENFQDEDFRRRFHAESQAVAMLSHPNIVSVYDVSSGGDADYIVMELIDGISLKQYMEKKGVLNWKETLHFAIQIAKALEHAHSRGLVHRDIKPHNIMVLKNGSVKVADFGIARIMAQNNTLTKEALGSVHYISPEQARGGRVDNRSDIYSLGVVMYEMITGRPPYDGESPVSVAIQHINGGAPRPSTLNPNIPAGLEQIILKAMEPDLHKRYASATAMLYDLDELRKDPTMVFTDAGAETSAEEKAPEGETPENLEASPNDKKIMEDETVDLLAVNNKAAQKSKQSIASRKGEEASSNNRNRVATIAVVICSMVAMIAIVVSMIMLLHGEKPAPEQPQVQVPYLLGIHFDRLPDYDGIVIVQQGSEYSSEYEKGQIIRQEPASGETVNRGRKVFVTISLGEKPADILMPDLVGMTKENAAAELDELNLGLKIKVIEENNDTIPAGTVISTNPVKDELLCEGGSTTPEFQTITVTVSIGPKMIEMPNLLEDGGWQLDRAQGKMDRQGFTNVEWVPVDSKLPKGTIVSQSVAAGMQVAVNTHIVIEYSNGNAPDMTVTMLYKFTELPNREESYLLSIMKGEEEIVVDQEIAPGQTSFTIELKGTGTQEYSLYIDGEFYKTVSVRFSEDGGEGGNPGGGDHGGEGGNPDGGDHGGEGGNPDGGDHGGEGGNPDGGGDHGGDGGNPDGSGDGNPEGGGTHE